MAGLKRFTTGPTLSVSGSATDAEENDAMQLTLDQAMLIYQRAIDKTAGAGEGAAWSRALEVVALFERWVVGTSDVKHSHP